MQEAKGEVERELHDAERGVRVASGGPATRAGGINSGNELEAEDDVLAKPTGAGKGQGAKTAVESERI